MSGLLSLSVMAAWVGACVKVVFVFCGIVMIRICTPRLGLGALGRLAWGSIFLYLTFFLYHLDHRHVLPSTCRQDAFAWVASAGMKRVATKASKP